MVPILQTAISMFPARPWRPCCSKTAVRDAGFRARGTIPSVNYGETGRTGVRVVRYDIPVSPNEHHGDFLSFLEPCEIHCSQYDLDRRRGFRKCDGFFRYLSDFLPGISPLPRRVQTVTTFASQKTTVRRFFMR